MSIVFLQVASYEELSSLKVFVLLGVSMKLTYLSPVQYWFIIYRNKVFIDNRMAWSHINYKGLIIKKVNYGGM